MFHIFGVEYFVALYGHLSGGVDGDDEGDVEVATRIADAGGEAQSLGCDHVEDEAFEHAVLPEVFVDVLLKGGFEEPFVEDFLAVERYEQVDVVVEEGVA